MKRFQLWRLPPIVGWNLLSPPQFGLLITPFAVVLLGIMVLVLQLNRQLYDQQQVIVNRLSHAAIRHVGQLQREHLRLWSMIAATTDSVNEDDYHAQLTLVQSQIHVLETTLDAVQPSNNIWERFFTYKTKWIALQPLLDDWRANPQNVEIKTAIGQRMASAERDVNQIAADVQSLFEDRMQGWADNSLFLNRLLTAGSFSFIIIILLMLYEIYWFFKRQATYQDSLRVSEQRLRVILDAIPDAVYRVSGSGIYTDYKPAANELHRLNKEMFYQKHLGDVLPLKVATMLQKGINTVLPKQQPLLLEYPLTDPQDNRTHLYEARLLPSGADEVQIIVRDITEVKQQEEATIQAQKLESLGILAGGIAHDFNNLLTGMLGQASLAVAKTNRGLPALDHIQKVVISAERAADLTRQLLAYTGKGKFQIDLLDLNQLVRDTTALMGTVMPNQAKLTFALQDELPAVRADRGQIQQVVMNLFINAIEALPDGKGTITIVTGTQWVKGAVNYSAPSATAEATSTSELPDGNYVTLRVEDTGIGMNQGTLSRIFDPFFSTKTKGHGLGLSATMGIVRTHQGALQVQSNIGVGTSFTLLLPAHTEEHATTVTSPTPSTLYNEKQQSILVIDDEAPVRETATDILADKGFQVQAAASGPEGIDLFRHQHPQIDIVLLDMKMPGMNGTETFQHLRQIEPKLKVIFTSGYSDTEIDQQIHHAELVSFLPKPYTAEVLTAQIHQMLASTS